MIVGLPGVAFEVLRKEAESLGFSTDTLDSLAAKIAQRDQDCYSNLLSSVQANSFNGKSLLSLVEFASCSVQVFGYTLSPVSVCKSSILCPIMSSRSYGSIFGQI